MRLRLHILSPRSHFSFFFLRSRFLGSFFRLLVPRPPFSAGPVGILRGKLRFSWEKEGGRTAKLSRDLACGITVFVVCVAQRTPVAGEGSGRELVSRREAVRQKKEVRKKAKRAKKGPQEGNATQDKAVVLRHSSGMTFRKKRESANLGVRRLLRQVFCLFFALVL